MTLWPLKFTTIECCIETQSIRRWLNSLYVLFPGELCLVWGKGCFVRPTQRTRSVTDFHFLLPSISTLLSSLSHPPSPSKPPYVWSKCHIRWRRLIFYYRSHTPFRPMNANMVKDHRHHHPPSLFLLLPFAPQWNQCDHRTSYFIYMCYTCEYK